MKRQLLLGFCCCSALLLGMPNRAAAQTSRATIVPAGTLLHCTLDEPKFSSKTASVGDPVICHLSSLVLFDHSVFPRGAYLGGHLEAAKEPGHFVGKGDLDIVFDHLGFPDKVLPMPTKVIAARGYNVNRDGDIVGHGHAVRDTVEWLLPPLWPEKILTLPARGPRPELKGEEQLTLRLMDDIAVPDDTLPAGWHYFTPSSYQPQPTYQYQPAYQPAYRYQPRTVAPCYCGVSSTVAPPQPAVTPAFAIQAVQATAPTPRAAAVASVAVYSKPTVTPSSTGTNLLILADGAEFLVTNMHSDGAHLTYTLANGAIGVVEMGQVDWNKTFQSNAAGITVTLQR